MNRALKIVTAAALVAALGFAGYEGYGVWTTHSELAAAGEKAARAKSSTSNLNATLKDAEARLQAEEDQGKILAAAAEARATFNNSLEAAKEQLNAASGKVDTASQQKRIVAAQTAVIRDYSDAKLIETQAAELSAVAEELKGLIAEADRKESAAKAAAASEVVPATVGTGSNLTSKSSGAQVASTPAGDWFSDMRARLNAVGGGSVPLKEFDGNCQGVISVACSDSNGLIMVAPSIASWSSARKNTVMAHELAHQYQFPIMEQIKSSPTYQSLFGGNIELLANCMASARGYTAHGMSCTQPRIDWARSIWSGVVPS